MVIRQTFTKKERLRSKKVIEQLFEKGNSLNNFPIRIVYDVTTSEDGVPVQAAVVVSKRYLKRAVDRNKIKRRMREAYRKNKHLLVEKTEKEKQLSLVLLYSSKELLAYSEIENKVIGVLNKLIEKIK